MEMSTCPKCLGEGIIGDKAEECNLCLGKGYVPKDMADKFVDLMIQLSEVLMEVEGE